MKISELVTQLQFHQRLHGDIEVVQRDWMADWKLDPIVASEIETARQGLPTLGGEKNFVSVSVDTRRFDGDAMSDLQKNPQQKVLLLR